MTRRRAFWAIIAICILGWWIPHVNTGLRYGTILILVGYTGIAAVLARRNTGFRREAAVCGAGSIGLVFAPSWAIPIIALPVILLTRAYLDVGVQILSHYVRHGRLPEAQANQVERDDQHSGQSDETVPPPRRQLRDSTQHRQQSRQLEPDLDTDSLRNNRWR